MYVQIHQSGSDRQKLVCESFELRVKRLLKGVLCCPMYARCDHDDIVREDLTRSAKRCDLNRRVHYSARGRYIRSMPHQERSRQAQNSCRRITTRR